ncbi:hypothetical protein LXL04_003876 [Taraxacum kok-saghyz]
MVDFVVSTDEVSNASFYLKNILPILMKNQVVHFVGFGNRLVADPTPYDRQNIYVGIWVCGRRGERNRWSAPGEQGLQDHLVGKKHESKVATLKASNTETELLEKKMEWTWMCPICKIGMKSDANFQSHLAGKKHKANVAIRKGKII